MKEGRKEGTGERAPTEAEREEKSSGFGPRSLGFGAAVEHGREAQWPGRGENAVAKVDFGAQFWPPLRPIGIPACVFSTFFWNGFWTGKNAHAGGAVQNM